MTDLFGDLWTNKSGDQCDEQGSYQPTFLLWCRKCDGLKPTEYTKGFEQLEVNCRLALKLGKKCYPPNYAEFVGMCKADHKAVAHTNFKDPNHPTNDPDSVNYVAIEDQGAKERSKVASVKTLANLKGMFP